MGKLKGKDLAKIASTYEKIEKAYKTQIYFCFASVSDGEAAFNILKRVYADECNYDAWSGWFGSGDKRDFYLGFKSKAVRDNVLSEINESIAEYRRANPEDVNYSSSNTPDEDTEDEPAKSTDWTTWIVIGAAAAVIILLLWDKKKK